MRRCLKCRKPTDGTTYDCGVHLPICGECKREEDIAINNRINSLSVKEKK